MSDHDEYAADDYDEYAADDYDEYRYRPPASYVDCECGRGTYNENEYASCYECFLDRRSNYLTCIECGVRWHDPEYPACYHCTHQWPASERIARSEASRARRFHVLYRDRWRCVECHAREDLQIDHLKPCAEGGNAMPWNLEVRCGPCNRAKSDTWWRGCRYDRRRTELLAEYFLFLRPLLTTEENAALRCEVAAIRGPNYRPPVIDPSPVIDTTGYESDYPELFNLAPFLIADAFAAPGHPVTVTELPHAQHAYEEPPKKREETKMIVELTQEELRAVDSLWDTIADHVDFCYELIGGPDGCYGRRYYDDDLDRAATLRDRGLADDEIARIIGHSIRFRKVAAGYPVVVVLAYDGDTARAAVDSDEQVAAIVAAWERAQGLEPRDWPAIGRDERTTNNHAG